MRKYPVFLLLLLLFNLPLAAQDTPQETYRLRELTAGEYVAALPEIWRTLELAPDPPAFSGVWAVPRMELQFQLVQLLETQFNQRFTDTATAEDLMAIYTVLNRGWSLYSYYEPFIDPRGWNMRIVERWLQENPTDLSTAETLTFGPYTITVSRHHLTDAETPEIVLHVDRSDYRDYWQTSLEDDVYQFQPLPLNYYESQYWPAHVNGTWGDFVEFRDVNADGLEDVIVLDWASLPQASSIASREFYTIDTWQQGQWKQVLRAEAFANASQVSDQPQWQLVNLDTDDALELLQNDFRVDSYFCREHHQRIYDWNGLIYETIADEVNQEDSVGCSLRAAQSAMHDHDYAAAVNFYAQVLERFNGDFTEYDGQQTDAVEQFAAYAQERLFIAALLAGDKARAMETLDTMRDQPLIENTMAEQFLALSEEQIDALTVCETAYTFLETVDQGMYRNLSNLSYLVDDIYGVQFFTGPVDPARVGCDLPYLQIEQGLIAPPSTPTPPPSLPPSTPSPETLLESQLRSGVSGLVGANRGQQPEAVLEQSAAILDLVGTQLEADSQYALLARFHRALALETLDRPDEALAEYTAIYEAAPDSAWGMLAALHLEAME